MYMLSRALASAGVDVDLWTTRTASLPAISRFGVRWDNAIPRRTERLDGIDVRRYTTFNLPTPLVRLLDRWLIARWRREERLAPGLGPAHGTGHLGAGWHPPETYGPLTMRWTEQQADVTIHDRAISEIGFEAMCPTGIAGRLEVNGRVVGVFRTAKGWTRYRFEVDGCDALNGRIVLERTWRPAADPRRLGIAIRSLAYTTRGLEKSIDLNDDGLQRLKRDRDAWIAHLTARAWQRPWFFETLFFLLRAPLAPRLLSDLETSLKGYDVVLAQMTPYSTLNYAIAFGARHGVPVVLLPHFHTEDDFYHLRHYYHAFRRAAAVLAFSPFQEAFFEGLGARTEVIGGGGVDPAEFRGHDESGRRFRQRFGVEQVPLILFVGRKSRSKRYDVVIKAVDFLHEHLGCKLVMVGPDEDGQPIASPNVLYLGRQERAVVLEAYYAADVFAMMSESESFGMVFLEAWMAKRPVIGNRACRAVADLIAEGHDGFLCTDELECAEKMAELILDTRLAHRLGANGYEKVMKDYTWDAIGGKVATIYETVSGGAEARRREARG
jgi:glycosyltransferase involved in cell wall biosynthesis